MRGVTMPLLRTGGTHEFHLEGHSEADFLIPPSDQAVVDKETVDWAILWQESNAYDAPMFECSSASLPKLSDQELRYAAMSFPANTGLGADGIAPRAKARLSDEAIQALASMFAAFEGNGSWCQALNLVLIVLLPKET